MKSNIQDTFTPKNLRSWKKNMRLVYAWKFWELHANRDVFHCTMLTGKTMNLGFPVHQLTQTQTNTTTKLQTLIDRLCEIRHSDSIEVLTSFLGCSSRFSVNEEHALWTRPCLCVTSFTTLLQQWPWITLSQQWRWTTLTMSVFLDVGPCNLVEIYRRFRGTYCLRQKTVIFILVAMRTWNLT
jgi:hypothetical protein